MATLILILILRDLYYISVKTTQQQPNTSKLGQPMRALHYENSHSEVKSGCACFSE